MGVSSTASTFWRAQELLGLRTAALSPSYIRFGPFPGREPCGVSGIWPRNGADPLIWGVSTAAPHISSCLSHFRARGLVFQMCWASP